MRDLVQNVCHTSICLSNSPSPCTDHTRIVKSSHLSTFVETSDRKQRQTGVMGDGVHCIGRRHLRMPVHTHMFSISEARCARVTILIVLLCMFAQSCAWRLVSESPRIRTHVCAFLRICSHRGSSRMRPEFARFFAMFAFGYLVVSNCRSLVPDQARTYTYS